MGGLGTVMVCHLVCLLVAVVIHLLCPTFWDPMDCNFLGSLSFTISRSLLKLLSPDSVMPSNHLILCYSFLLLPSIFPSTKVFSSEPAFHIRWPKYGASTLAEVLPVSIQGWFPLGLTGLISLQTKGLSRVFSSTTIQKHQFFGAQPSLWSNSHIRTWLLEKPQLNYTELCQQNDVSSFYCAV